MKGDYEGLVIYLVMGSIDGYGLVDYIYNFNINQFFVFIVIFTVFGFISYLGLKDYMYG